MQLTLGELVTLTLSGIEVQGKKERCKNIKKLFVLVMKKEPLIRTVVYQSVFLVFIFLFPYIENMYFSLPVIKMCHHICVCVFVCAYILFY